MDGNIDRIELIRVDKICLREGRIGRLLDDYLFRDACPRVDGEGREAGGRGGGGEGRTTWPDRRGETTPIAAGEGGVPLRRGDRRGGGDTEAEAAGGEEAAVDAATAAAAGTAGGGGDPLWVVSSGRGEDFWVGSRGGETSP